ncbi:MAG: hypothetical protein V1740_04860 [Candidatus Woesearchaeota archaeon]
MEQKFHEINGEYTRFYGNFLKNGKFPMKETKLGFWGYSIGNEVFELFKKIGLQNYQNFLDLGSGDGKVVNIASLFTNSVGVEVDEELVGISNEIRESLGLKKASFLNEDFMNLDISKYEILYLYPDKRINEIESKLLREMNGILLFVGLHFHPMRLKKIKEFYIGTNLVTVYEVP